MNHWLVKSEPNKYSWDKFNEDGKTIWDGVRNFTARNNLRLMEKGDFVFFYHSNIGKEIVGIAKVTKTAYQDPTSEDPNWVAVDLVPLEKLKNPVSLHQIKAEPSLKDIQLLKLSRISVASIKREEFDKILAMSES